LTVPVTDKPFALLATSTGIALTTIYFVQKQKLEEIRLFKDLFTEFNERYDCLNGKIADIKSKKITDLAETNKILDDYFNLCAEEYLFYREDRILNLVPCLKNYSRQTGNLSCLKFAMKEVVKVCRLDY